MERTKRALVTAAVDLFIRQGYEGTSVDEIAAAAGVSRRTFFRYFPAKEEVLLQLMTHEIDICIEALENRPADESVLDALCEMATAEKRGALHLPTALRLYRAVRYTPELRGPVSTWVDYFRDSVAGWVARRLELPVDHRSVQYIAAGATAARETAMRIWAEGDDPDALPDLLDEAYRALVPPAAEHAAERRSS